MKWELWEARKVPTEPAEEEEISVYTHTSYAWHLAKKEHHNNLLGRDFQKNASISRAVKLELVWNPPLLKYLVINIYINILRSRPPRRTCSAYRPTSQPFSARNCRRENWLLGKRTFPKFFAFFGFCDVLFFFRFFVTWGREDKARGSCVIAAPEPTVVQQQHHNNSKRARVCLCVASSRHSRSSQSKSWNMTAGEVLFSEAMLQLC